MNDLLQNSSFDWSEIVSQVQRLCFFPLSAESFNQSQHFSNEIQLQEELKKLSALAPFSSQVQKALSEAKVEKEIPVKKIMKHALLGLPELNRLGRIIEGYSSLQTILPGPSFVFSSVPKLLSSNFLRELRLIISPDETIIYDKHPKLREINLKIQENERKIKALLQDIIVSYSQKNLLAHENYDLINQQYVILVSADKYSSSMGRIIYHSSSGKSLYIEPKRISILNQERLEILYQFDEALLAIERELITLLAPHCNELTLYFNALIEIDCLQAKYRYCLRHNFIEPTLQSHSDYFELIGLFNPLIENPVLNDLKISSHKRGLVISGPNTGGKTVLLKSIALAFTFLQNGFFMPVQAATVFPFTQIFFFGEDAQNIISGHSSFSSEVCRLLEALNCLDSRTLIIIDEIFSSTAEKEGAALALGLIDWLLDQPDTYFIISTHFYDLKFKTLENESIESAHMGFGENNKPTYKLHLGSPGPSKAFEIFESLSSQSRPGKEVFARAQQYKSSEEIDNVVKQLMTKERNLEDLIQENESIKRELNKKEASFHDEIALRKEREKQRINREVEQKIEKIEKIFNQAKAGQISHKKSLNLLSQEKTQSISLKKDPDGLTTPKKFQLNQKYYHLGLKQWGVLQSYQSSEGVFLLGALKMTVKLAELRQDPSQKNQPSFQYTYPEDTDEKLVYDCRGMFLEEFQNLVNKEVYSLRLGGRPYITFIHGHGDGVLKKWIRQEFQDKKEFALTSENEQDDGASTIKLNQSR